MAAHRAGTCSGMVSYGDGVPAKSLLQGREGTPRAAGSSDTDPLVSGTIARTYCTFAAIVSERKAGPSVCVARKGPGKGAQVRVAMAARREAYARVHIPPREAPV